MCGIAGAFHYQGGRPQPGLVQRQVRLMEHRGPDGDGAWYGEGVAFGHGRLALVDLTEGGRQPMENEDGTLRLVFNGELYGWREIRSDLIARGHVFRGASDAEILLHLYEDHGDAVMQHLRGEFAFALYDGRRRRLLMARDRAGVKPLYYHDNGSRLTFASELKALMIDPSVPRQVDERAVLDYLTLRYVPSPRTIWSNIRKLSPGHTLVCDEDGARIERYWSLPVETGCELSEADAREQLADLLDEAVRLRMIADVPVGAFLSGGVDSSAVVALMARASSSRIKTFTVGFETKSSSEIDHARLVAQHLGTEHQELIIGPEVLKLLPRVVWGLDEPFADASILPTFCVSRLASAEVKTVLSGDGGDETFGGYKTYVSALRHEHMNRIPGPLRRLAGLAARGFRDDHPLARKLRRIPMSVLERHLEAMAGFPPAELDRVLAPGLRSFSRSEDVFGDLRKAHALLTRDMGEVRALLPLDAGTYLADDVLKKVDCASMLNSLEVRVPLLDHKLLEFAASLAFQHKIKGSTTKWILKESVRDLLPPQILEQAKTGFNLPLEAWLGCEFGALAREVLLDRRARERGWLDTVEVERRLTGNSDDRFGAQQLWSLVSLEAWAQCHLDSGRAIPPA